MGWMSGGERPMHDWYVGVHFSQTHWIVLELACLCVELLLQLGRMCSAVGD